jgi:hypothetical protein
MDDFNVSSLHESKNEWGSRLVTILTPLVIDGYKSILDEAVKLCKENNEMNKYLMTFQNLISRIPKWNSAIIETERKRICDKSHCSYLEDLVTCVHIIQLKVLTAMRVGQKQKKIDISIPKLDDFIHKIYINVARKIYKNTYLFEINIPPLQTQKNNRELEIIVQECIFNTIRESIPVEAILKAYMDETVEEDVVEEIKEQVIEQPKVNTASIEKPQIISEEKEESKQVIESIKSIESIESSANLKFNDIDMIRDENNKEQQIVAPKDIQRLEEINNLRNAQRKLEESMDDSDNEEENVKLNIFDENIHLDNLDIHVIDPPELELIPDLLLDDIEVLP